MKNRFLFLFISVALLSSCNTERGQLPNDQDIHMVIVDSIQVDFMGNLFPFDFNPDDGLYLGRWNSTDENIFFDDDGVIHHRFRLPKDGPNAINWAMGIGFLDGRFTIMEQQKGLIQYSKEGEIINRISIPENYFFFNGLHNAAYKLGDEYAYSRPEREGFDSEGIDWDDLEGLLQKNYKSPLLEVFDPESNQIRNTMEFPEHTVYSSGNFYNAVPPGIIKYGKEWLLFLLAEMKYFVYEEKAGEVVFVKAVDLQLENAIPMPGVPMKEYAEWYPEKGHIIFGKIEHLYRRDKDVIVVYTKGVDEEISKNYSPENRTEWMDFIYNIPRYAAVFDHDHMLIKNDIPLPKGMIWSSVVNMNGEILALKNQDYFGVEEDFVTFYKLNIRKN